MALQRTTIRLPHSRNCCHQKQRGQQDNAKQQRHQRRHRNMQQRQLRYHSRQPRNNIQKRQSIRTGRNLIIITTQRRRRNLIIITTQRRRRNLQRMTSTPMLWKTYRPNQRQQLTSYVTADTSHTREIPVSRTRRTPQSKTAEQQFNSGTGSRKTRSKAQPSTHTNTRQTNLHAAWHSTQK